MLFTEFDADPVRRFARDLDRVDERECQHFIVVQILAVVSFGEMNR